MTAWYVPSAGEQPRLGELPVPEVGDHAIPPAKLGHGPAGPCRHHHGAPAPRTCP
jgi:hypothetical protein